MCLAQDMRGYEEFLQKKQVEKSAFLPLWYVEEEDLGLESWFLSTLDLPG